MTEIKKNTFAYCSGLSELIIPESVRRIHERALYASGLKEIHLPDGIEYFHNEGVDYELKHQIFYRGLDFMNYITLRYPNGLGTVKSMKAGRCIDMIRNRDFSYHTYTSIPSTGRELLIIQLILQNPEEENSKLYIKEHFAEDFRTLIDYKDMEAIRLVVDNHLFLNQDNIDGLIEYAIDKEFYEIQAMLTDYKYRYIGYESDEEIIRKKFEL